MTKIDNRPPKGEAWIWETLEMLESDAYWSIGGPEYRFIAFLCVEHMRHAGQHNGKLKAPYRQLDGRVCSENYISTAIARCVDVGFVDAFPRGRRAATEYALTWYPLHDGTPATNRWREYRNPKLKPWPEKKARPK